jgi:Protein of unknown function (DUF1592)/Protein of unknown function (DUF1588)/Protein of unknown function (DUF1595)/Protein of unknown function (DUF1587)/Protein of unknown function (DUF1585)
MRSGLNDRKLAPKIGACSLADAIASTRPKAADSSNLWQSNPVLDGQRRGRKVLVASIGVAAVSYVACGGKSIGTSAEPGNGAGGSANAGAGGTNLATTVGNLAPPPDLCGALSSQGTPPVTVGQSTPLELTNPEYDRTVRDLLGDTSSPSKEFPADSTDIGFRRDVAGADPTRIAHYAKAANDLADAAVGRLDSILPCNSAIAGEDACAAQFIEAFGKRAFRRPLTSDEIASFRQTYVDARGSGTFVFAIRSLISAALMSPHFYQLEEKTSSSPPALLGPYALASRLSYFIYRSMPDAALFAAADAGKLSTPDEIAAQARRMLQDPKAHDGVTDFFKEWLRLDTLSTMDKSAAVLPNFTAVRDSMITETTMFTESIFFGSSRYADLLTSSSTWVNADIADIYGVPFMGTGFQPVTLDGAVRSGLLTQPSILSLTSGDEYSSPTLRGKFVREALLCQEIPLPPPDIHWAPFDPPSPGVTTRDRYAKAMANPACGACHRMMDPIGFSFEGFDAVGRYRTMDNGLPIDLSGSADLDGGAGITFQGVVELALKLSLRPQVPDCVGTQWVRFALLRTETDQEQCALQSAQQTLRDSGKMTDMVVAIATSTSFRYARW